MKTADELALVESKQLRVALMPQPQLSFAICPQHHLQHLPDAELLCQKVASPGLGRIRTDDQPVMSRPLCH